MQVQRLSTGSGSVIMSVRQRGRIERGLGPASAGSFHGEFPYVVQMPTRSRVDLAGFALISGWIDPRPSTAPTAELVVEWWKGLAERRPIRLSISRTSSRMCFNCMPQQVFRLIFRQDTVLN